MNKKYILALVGILILSGIFLIATKNTPKPDPITDATLKTYISNELGIEMQFPLNFFYQEPATIILDCKTAALPGSCPQVEDENSTIQNEVSIGGKTYCAQIEADAAAGSRYDKSNFNIKNEKGCFSLELVVRSTNCGVYGLPEDAKYQNCEKENAAKPAVFKNILTSIKDTTAKTDFGFIRKIENRDGKYFIAFDNALWLTGEAGKAAAIRANQCPKELQPGCLLNGYFIENTDKSNVDLELAKNAEIQMETFETGEPGDQKEIISLEKFTELIDNQTLHWNQLPYHLIIEDGKITKISEQYIP